MTEQNDAGRAPAGGPTSDVPPPRAPAVPGQGRQPSHLAGAATSAPWTVRPAPEQPPPPGPPAPAVTLPSTGTLPPSAPSAPSAPSGTGTRRRGWGVAASMLLLSTVLLLGASVYLWRTSDAWQARAEDYGRASTDLGGDLADSQARLESTSAELDQVREQLATAQTRIIQLANEKAQVGDDREAQRMLADYQERVSDAAGRVALALDQCVQGQDQLIGYLQTPELYDPAQLDAFAADVQDLCQAATDANNGLQAELSR